MFAIEQMKLIQQISITFIQQVIAQSFTSGSMLPKIAECACVQSLCGHSVNWNTVPAQPLFLKKEFIQSCSLKFLFRRTGPVEILPFIADRIRIWFYYDLQVFFVSLFVKIHIHQYA